MFAIHASFACQSRTLMACLFLAFGVFHHCHAVGAFLVILFVESSTWRPVCGLGVLIMVFLSFKARLTLLDVRRSTPRTSLKSCAV